MRAVSTFHNCPHNLLRAVVERSFLVKGDDGVYRRPGQPEAGFYNALETTALAIAARVGMLTPMSRSDFCRRYSGSKRRRYEKAGESLDHLPVVEEDAYIIGFVKVEPTDGTDKDPVPRLISMRGFRYALELGRYLCVAEERLYHAVAEHFHERPTNTPIILKGYNLRDRAEIMREKVDAIPDWVAISVDANRFDQHVSVPALLLEHLIYNKVFRSSYLAMLLRWQLRNVGSAYFKDVMIKWAVHGVRQSGDMNTSLGNCLLMSILAMSYLRSLGVLGEVINDGDDTVFIVSRRDADRVIGGMEGYFRRAGFSLRVEGVTDVFERIDFCQCRPVHLVDGWCLVRKPWRALANAGVGCGNWAQPALQPIMLWSQGISGVHMNWAVPVMEHFYREMVAHGKRPRRGGLVDDKSGMSREVRRMAGSRHFKLESMPVQLPEIPDFTRISFSQAFDIHPSLQRQLESIKLEWRGPQTGRVCPSDWDTWRDNITNAYCSLIDSRRYN